MSQTGGCRCGCGGHGKRNEQDERAAAPAVAQPQGVTPGHKAGNLLGLRDVSASASGGGGCGCGGH